MATPDPSQVLELRQYTCQPGQRDALIELFDRAFLASQDAVGMRVLGQFRDLDDPDRFVWLRGFPALATRAAALEAFYGGPVWQAHRAAANATMIDSDNVLLLRPAGAGDALELPEARPAAPLADDAGRIVITTYLLAAPIDAATVRWFTDELGQLLTATGAPPLARLVTEYGKNDFPRLPVREGEHALVWLTSFASDADHARHRAALADALAGQPDVADELARRSAAPPHTLRLAPTARSLLRHRAPVGFTTAQRGDVRDFDFLAGDWDVHHRRLVARGVGATEWDEFPATMRARLQLGGIANVDEIACPARGWSGMTVRHFRLADRQWSIRWISSRTGAMDPAVVGGFTGDRGTFYGWDVDAGRRVAVRFVWTRLGRDAARWEQAFSYGGGPWETNWIMSFRRIADAP
jgi:hypothetical protein